MPFDFAQAEQRDTERSCPQKSFSPSDVEG
jgi:hypothetical protein